MRRQIASLWPRDARPIDKALVSDQRISPAGFATTFFASLVLAALQATAADIHIETASVAKMAPVTPSYPNQLPHSRVSRGKHDIAVAYLANPTERYRHGVLGDRLEAASLIVFTRDGQQVQIDLPTDRVFEDLEPRLADLDHDSRDEIILVESDAKLGASLAVYGLRNGKIMLLSRGPFIGTANRWLNPLGIGDFDADGRLDLAVVVTPHIGGLLKIYRYTPGALTLIAETDDVSTHRHGSSELGMGAVVTVQNGADRMLVPDNTHRRLRLLALKQGKLDEQAAVELQHPLAGALQPDGHLRWSAPLSNGRGIRMTIRP